MILLFLSLSLIVIRLQNVHLKKRRRKNEDLSVYIDYLLCVLYHATQNRSADTTHLNFSADPEIC